MQEDSLSKFFRRCQKNYDGTSLLSCLFASQDKKMNGDARVSDSIRSTISPKAMHRFVCLLQECSYIFKTGAPRRATTKLSLSSYGLSCLPMLLQTDAPQRQHKNVMIDLCRGERNDNKAGLLIISISTVMRDMKEIQNDPHIFYVSRLCDTLNVSE